MIVVISNTFYLNYKTSSLVASLPLPSFLGLTLFTLSLPVLLTCSVFGLLLFLPFVITEQSLTNEEQD